MPTDKKRSLTAPGQLVSAICYAALVGVVAYGRNHYVYDGFSSAVPVGIMAVFAAMSVVRLIGFCRSVKAQKTVSEYDRARSELDAADCGLPDSEEEIYGE